MSTRFAAVVSHPIQHFAPMFRNLAQVPGFDVKVFYCCDWGVHEYHDPGFGKTIEWDVPLLDGYTYEFLPIARRPRDLGFREIDNPAVARRLQEFRPDVVWIHGYSHLTQWRVWLWCRHNSVRSLFFGDSELLHRRPLVSRILKRAILPHFFSRISAFITIGDNNEAYYGFYGVPKLKMFRGAYPVDIERFRGAVRNISARDRAAIRVEFGLRPDSVVVLFVGKLIPIKRPLDLVEALARLRGHKPRIEALFVGDGELRNAAVEHAEQNGVGDCVRFAGFVNQSEMPRVLHAGDILAMCSEKDPHPLAVTEAMAVGNVIVASDRVGCVGPTDSARPDVNALVYPCGNAAELAQKIASLASDTSLRRRLSDKAIETASTQDTSVTVSAVVRAVGFFTQTT